MPYDFSDRLRQFVAGWETLRLTAYDDGGGVLTLGYGHTAGVKAGDTCTAHQANMWLFDDLDVAAEGVRHNVTELLTQNQFDALTSFVFNLGESRFAGSTLLQMVNAGRHERAAIEFLRWNKQGNKVLRGLLARRAGEALMYARADYGGV